MRRSAGPDGRLGGRRADLKVRGPGPTHPPPSLKVSARNSDAQPPSSSPDPQRPNLRGEGWVRLLPTPPVLAAGGPPTARSCRA